MKFTSKSSIGLIRKQNEDSFCINEDINLIAVADGMGGHRAGEVASSMAVKSFEDYLLEHRGALTDNPQDTMQKAMQEANRIIYETARKNSSQKGMGTTLTAAVFKGSNLFLAHVGDSRAYLIHNDNIKQITQDHSLVNEMVKNGSLTEEEASHHPQKNILTRALGTSPNVIIDLMQIKIKEEDLVILCSDGLTNLVSCDEIREFSRQESDMDRFVEILVDKAIERGGFDNVTVVVCRV